MTILHPRSVSSIEPLEARIAPAHVVVNPIADIVAGAGKTGTTVELSQLFDPNVANPGHTLVTFSTNIDADPNTGGMQPSTFVIELFDDEAPLTVQNFLRYAKNPDPAEDYTNTFFHRAIANFVIQGGGFDAANPDEHIPVGPEVHNEFSADRSNLRGTVAMAKTGLGPNTATSEWFVNLKDNSGNLDSQNGGFTVFGEVIQGLELFDKIALLQKSNQGGALTDLPVQNYNADPDNNPNTPAPEPTPNQLIRITDVTVTKPVPGVATGTTFVVKSITDSTTNAPSDLLTATIGGANNAKLKLKYASGEAGIANVTITATQGGHSVDETFQVKVLPNLIANLVDDTLPKIIASGDAGNAVVTLTNTGAGQLTTNVDVKFYLSKAGGTDPNGTTFDASDLLIGQLTAQPVSLANGASVDLTALVKLPKAVAAETGPHRVIAQVTTSSGSTLTELFTDDNNAIDGDVHSLVNQFGEVTVQNFGTRVIPKFAYSEADGDKVVLRLAGEGSASLTKDGTEFDLTVSGSDAASVLTAENKAAGGRIALDDINLNDPIGTVSFGRVDSSGFITASEGVQKLVLGSLSGDRTLIIGASSAGAAATIKLRSVTDVSLESDQPVASLTARQWLDTTGANDRIIAPKLGSLNITGAPAKGTTPAVPGDFEANLTVQSGTVESINIAGFLRDATVSLPKSNVGTVTLGGMDNSDFFVGTTGRPDAVSDFTNVRTIDSFTVGGGATGTRFSDSQVAAANFGTISVTGVDGASSTAPFGFVADSVLSYTRPGGPTGTNLTTAQVFDPVGSYSLTIL